ncbi:hypothetical protein Q4574_10575 [Aliiglaciecola sp. 3_MG-2023]|uniref:hypothetical protein n=1 Tax=Aliiglaciecola sp. 3_MG-2023 TaxID=3062644 RepID=UPI0026E33BFB|nr:hypothetical protein [Aliiglaciecola sp. 3_MG-2023]MDO6693732.1 hypothetical protein [Aliiglaciecola sp. 3_MG-2023]
MLRLFLFLSVFVSAISGFASEPTKVSTYAKYVDADHVSIKGKLFTISELLEHLVKEYSNGKIIELSISGKPSEQTSILSLAAKIEKSPNYKADGVAVFIVSW